MADDGIEGLKMKTFGPNSGLLAARDTAGKAEYVSRATARVVLTTRRQASNKPRSLPRICSRRFCRQHGGEQQAVVLHVEGLGKIGRIRYHQHDPAVRGEKRDRGKLFLLRRSDTHGTRWHELRKVGDSIVRHILRNMVAV